MQYEEYLKERQNQEKIPSKIANKIQPKHVILFAVLVLIGTLIIKTNQGKWVYYVLGGFVVLYLFSLWKQTAGQKQIPRDVAQKMAKDDLLSEVGPGGVFIIGTEINPTGNFKDQTFDSGDGPKLIKYNLGFKIKEPGKPPKEIIYQMSPFTGMCKGWVDAPIGFTGQDVKDVQLIFPEKFIKEEKPKDI
ncbi:MAG: hypothetical protein KKB31_05850 [Nanoarchaeota archaeon]|nr:hypothetical protein [Nanoarchaeota archaeon]